MAAIDYEMMREMLCRGFSNLEIARRLGCSTASVQRAAERFGARRVKKRGPLDVPLLFKLWSEGVMKDEIARQLGCSVSHVTALKTKYKLPKRKPQARQVDTDPTPEQIEERAAECRARRVMVEKAYATAGIRNYVYSSRTGVFTPSRIA